jgi:hypothetical protein
VLASKVAGPSRGMPWIRAGAGMTAADIVASCEASLKRLQTDVIDLYQIHWPERHVPAFGRLYYDPARSARKRPSTSSCRRWRAWCRPARCATSACPTRRPTACTSSCAWPSSGPAARGQRAEPLLPDQPRGGQRAGRDLPPPEVACWPIRRWASAC